MFSVINPKAPSLRGTLSPEAECQVREMRASGALSRFATPDSAIIRRNEEHDEETALRPAFARDADKILYMEHGDILEAGTHDELMALDGRYATLYNSQFAEG